jgi:hypothetical protein
VEEVFLQAVEKDPADRPAFLDKACTNSRLRTRVEALLKAHDTAGNFLDGPAVRPAALVDTEDHHAGDSVCTSVHEPLELLTHGATPGRLGLFAHYEILEVLGRGGMGTMLRGVDVKLNCAVAIKVLAPQLAANATARGDTGLAVLERVAAANSGSQPGHPRTAGDRKQAAAQKSRRPLQTAGEFRRAVEPVSRGPAAESSSAVPGPGTTSAAHHSRRSRRNKEQPALTVNQAKLHEERPRSCSGLKFLAVVRVAAICG